MTEESTGEVACTMMRSIGTTSRRQNRQHYSMHSPRPHCRGAGRGEHTRSWPVQGARGCENSGARVGYPAPRERGRGGVASSKSGARAGLENMSLAYLMEGGGGWNDAADRGGTAVCRRAHGHPAPAVTAASYGRMGNIILLKALLLSPCAYVVASFDHHREGMKR
eukprot:7273032-Prymnesium_polylepis.1